MKGRATVIHVADREADFYELVSHFVANKMRFVVRFRRHRTVEDKGSEQAIGDWVENLTGRVKVKVTLSKRKRRAAPRGAGSSRPKRKATLSFSAGKVNVCRPKVGKAGAPAVAVNVVRVYEENCPAGQEPVEWILVTSEPIATVQAIKRVVRIYDTRWLIEEFFKALKTGCAIEERQAESYAVLEKILALYIPLAWQLLLLRNLSRTHATSPATVILSPEQLDLLRKVSPRPLPRLLSIEATTLALAALGGFLPQNKRPGWAVLGKGLQYLVACEVGYRLGANSTTGKCGG
jgi:hypothetical protein